MKCEICEMERDWCVHGLADRKTHQQPTHVTDELLVSPAGLAHLDGGNGTTAWSTRWSVTFNAGARSSASRTRGND